VGIGKILFKKDDPLKEMEELEQSAALPFLDEDDGFPGYTKKDGKRNKRLKIKKKKGKNNG